MKFKKGDFVYTKRNDFGKITEIHDGVGRKLYAVEILSKKYLLQNQLFIEREIKLVLSSPTPFQTYRSRLISFIKIHFQFLTKWFKRS